MIYLLVIKEWKCARATGQVKWSQKSTQEGKMSIKSRDLTVHTLMWKLRVDFGVGAKEWMYWASCELPCKSCTVVESILWYQCLYFSFLEGRHCKSNGDFSTVIFSAFFALPLWGVQLPCFFLLFCLDPPDKLLLLKQQELMLVISGHAEKCQKLVIKSSLYIK